MREPEPEGYGLLAVRALRPPIPLEVLVEPTARCVTTPVTEYTRKRPRIDGAVRVASGPWSLEEGWWNEEPVDPTHRDVELNNGGIYRIYQDRRSESLVR